MKRFLLHIILLLAFLPLLEGCSSHDMDGVSTNDLKVSLNVSARALSQDGKEIGNGTPDNMHLWVYGADDDQNTESYTKLAYRELTENIFSGSDPFGNPAHTITNWEIPDGKKYKKMYFYIVLNSENVVGLNIDENTTIEQLQEATFTGIVSDKTDNQMLMYGMNELDINQHTTNYEVSIEVERSVGKLELYFAKKESASNLTIKNVILSSPIGKGYLVSSNLKDDTTIYEEGEPETLFSGNEVIDKTLENEGYYGNFSQYETTNFKELILQNPYLMENPDGLDWTSHDADDKYPEIDTSEDVSKYYTVTINYEIDGTADTKVFYFPPIERNHLYKVYVRARTIDFDLEWEVVPFDKVTNDIPRFE